MKNSDSKLKIHQKFLKKIFGAETFHLPVRQAGFKLFTCLSGRQALNSPFRLRRKGFTLLLSLIVVSAILSVGLGVFDIVYRELILSGVGRESQKAFYAADTGIECAFYWDIKRGEISTSTSSTIDCAGQSASVGGLTSVFQITLPNGSCFEVIIDKNDASRTVLESRGYNVACDSTSPRRVERAIRVAY